RNLIKNERRWRNRTSDSVAGDCLRSSAENIFPSDHSGARLECGHDAEIVRVYHGGVQYSCECETENENAADSGHVTGSLLEKLESGCRDLNQISQFENVQ